MRISGRDLVSVKLIEDSARKWHATLEFITPRGTETVSVRVLEDGCLRLINRLGFLGDETLRGQAKKAG